MNTPLSSVRGFTLIELMVVIVIMAIMASLVLMNIGGVDQRKAMQAREVFLLDLRKLNREANDQARIFALNLHQATDVSPARYDVLEYQPCKIIKNGKTMANLKAERCLNKFLSKFYL